MIKPEYSRFDVPESVATVLNVALAHSVIDVKDIFSLGMSFDSVGGWDNVVTDISETAHSLIHITGKAEAYSRICEVVDAHFAKGVV